jgi:hypothetical protein
MMMGDMNMDYIITFGKPATYNKRKIIGVRTEGADIPLDTEYTIEKAYYDTVWTFYRTTKIWSADKNKKALLWTADLRKLKKAIIEQLPQALKHKKSE